MAAFIDGITRASKVCCTHFFYVLQYLCFFFRVQTAATGFDLTFIVTFVLLFLIDIGIVYWISFY